eukprot:15468671-Alexandrium_andersonii.AAC.1
MMRQPHSSSLRAAVKGLHCARGTSAAEKSAKRSRAPQHLVNRTTGSALRCARGAKQPACAPGCAAPGRPLARRARAKLQPGTSHIPPRT